MPLRVRLKILALGALLAYPVLAACGGKPDLGPTGDPNFDGRCGQGTNRNADCTTGGAECDAGAVCSPVVCIGGGNDGDACVDASNCGGAACGFPAQIFVDGPTQQNMLQEGTLWIDADGDTVPETGITVPKTPPSYTEPGLVAQLSNFVSVTAVFSVHMVGGHFSNDAAIRTVCIHEITALIAGESICGGTSRTRITAFAVSDEPSFSVRAEQARTDPASANPFDATVTVICSGPISAIVTDVPVGDPALPITVLDDGLTPGECVVEATIDDSRTGEQGETQHILTVTILQPGARCDSKDDCVDLYCVNGGCLSGLAGSSCTKPGECATGLFCVDGACRAGDPGDPCHESSECTTVGSTCPDTPPRFCTVP
jgi:hypothetical protein